MWLPVQPDEYFPTTLYVFEILDRQQFWSAELEKALSLIMRIDYHDIIN